MRGFLDRLRDHHQQPQGQQQQQQGNQERQQQQQGDSNPVMDFFRQSFGDQNVAQAADYAQAAAAQLGGFHFDPHQFVQAQQQQFQQHAQEQQGPRGPPPASPAALRQLPIISVCSQDLVEPSNRECCICFEEHNLHDKVVRLPCAHIYHAACIQDWLSRHCTCPTCRYELPTTDPQYEAGRRERMKARKPRYAKYELERMSIRELKALLPARYQRASSAMFSDKSDLIQHLISSEFVDLISTPPPVEFPSLAVLRAMGAGQLKRTMNDTGVFFDPRDVVEKEDMVQLFVNSGRICLVEAEEPTDTDSGGPDTGYGHAPCDHDSRQRTFSSDHTGVNDKDNPQSPPSKETNGVSNASDANENTRSPVVVETVRENEDDERQSQITGQSTQRSERAWDSSVVMVENHEVPTAQDTVNNSEVETNSTEVPSAAEEVQTTTEEEPLADTSETSVPNQEADAINNETGQNLGTGETQESTSSNEGDEELSQTNDDSFVDDPMDVDESEPGAENNETSSNGPAGGDASVVEGDSNDNEQDLDGSERKRQRRQEDEPQSDQEEEDPTNQLRDLSISELRSLARDRRIDVSRCIERGEMIQRIVSGSSNAGNAVNGLDPTIFQSWSVSNLRACANEVKVDFGPGASHEDMVEALLKAASTRPHVATYVKALSPLMGMTISQLRGQAREWQVNVLDCLEKGEIIRRLAGFVASRRP